MATCTIEEDKDLGGGMHLYTGTIAMDSSYPTGGEALDATGNRRFTRLFAAVTGGYVFSWDKANQKLLALRTKDPGNAGGADIVLQEVANAVDLSALTAVDFLAVGS